jgi:hypothetical protein
MPRVTGWDGLPLATQMLPTVPSGNAHRDELATTVTWPRGDTQSPAAHLTPVSRVCKPSKGGHRTGRSHVLHTNEIAVRLHV